MPKVSVFADKHLFLELVSSSSSVLEMIQKAGLTATKGGSSHKTVKKWASIHGVKLPEFIASQNKGRPARTYDDIFCENSTYGNYHLKNYIRKHKLLLWKCSNKDCDLEDTWLGKPLVLQLEHKNGINNDNRLENLELLCPNCHSQTSTFGGKKR